MLRFNDKNEIITEEYRAVLVGIQLDKDISYSMEELAGLAEADPSLRPGQAVSVYIKNILPRRMKMKLIIIEEFGPAPISRPVPVYMENHMDFFLYSPPECEKKVETVFSCAPTE